MDASIVVVTHDSGDVVSGFLATVALERTRGVGAEVILVDSGSMDGTVELVEARWPWVRTHRLDGNLGYAAGINAGVERAVAGTHIIVSNPDVRFQPGCLDGLLAPLSDPQVGISVPRILDAEGGLSHSIRRDPSVPRAFIEAVVGGGRSGRFGEVVLDEDAYDTAHDVDWATGAIMAISRPCWNACGPWDPTFFLYSEETEYAQRVRDHGFRVRYTPDAECIHVGGEAGTRPDLWALLVRNRVALYRRRHGAVASAAFHAAMFAGESVRAGRGRETSRAAAAGLLRPGSR